MTFLTIAIKHKAQAVRNNATLLKEALLLSNWCTRLSIHVFNTNVSEKD